MGWRYATRYTTVKKRDGLYPVWRCSTVRLETGYVSQQVELLHWEYDGYGCTAVGDTLHFFGGNCNHGDCFHNSIHSLSTSSLHWVELSPTTSEGGPAPMRKCYCGTVAFKDGEEDILYVVAGHWFYSHHIVSLEHSMKLLLLLVIYIRCNEQHMFSLSTSEWYCTYM